LGSTDPPAQASSRPARRAQWPLLGLLLAAIVAVYFFFISAGLGVGIASQSRYFTALADAFLDGNLHLAIQPAPELLAKRNPYDPGHSKLWVWDATLHEGRYYLYWGPVPALLAAAVKLVAGRALEVGDGWLGLAFVLGRLAVGTAILVLVLRRLFPGLPPWHAAPALAVFGLANPYPFDLGRVGVYEAAIEGAQLFLLAGLLLGLRAIGGAGSPSRQRVLLGLAGCAWGVALACRISLIVAVLALVPLSAWLSCPQAPARRREAAIRLVSTGAPVALAIFWLGFYNFARFGSWIDFGAAHQLGLLPYSFSIFRFLPNLHAYLLREVLISCRFPFVFAPFHATALTPSWVFAKQTGYMPLEPTVGMLVAAPCVLFGAVAVWRAAPLVSAGARTGAGLGERDRLYLWLVAACLTITLLGPVPALGMQFSTMRFLADFTSAALLLAAIGFWTLLSGAKSARRRRVIASAGALLGVYTLAAGILIGFQGGYYFSFQKLNPALHVWLDERFSVCE
jgi:hypothetical protein